MHRQGDSRPNAALCSTPSGLINRSNALKCFQSNARGVFLPVECTSSPSSVLMHFTHDTTNGAGLRAQIDDKKDEKQTVFCVSLI